MSFEVDSRIESTSYFLQAWPLSNVYLKNEKLYPWLILVPRVEKVQEIFHLDSVQQHQLMDEINKLSRIMTRYFNPVKLNIGALGNIVNQLHIHLVARFPTDQAWPHGIWQPGMDSRPYEAEEVPKLINELQPFLEL